MAKRFGVGGSMLFESGLSPELLNLMSDMGNLAGWEDEEPVGPFGVHPTLAGALIVAQTAAESGDGAEFTAPPDSPSELRLDAYCAVADAICQQVPQHLHKPVANLLDALSDREYDYTEGVANAVGAVAFLIGVGVGKAHPEYSMPCPSIEAMWQEIDRAIQQGDGHLFDEAVAEFPGPHVSVTSLLYQRLADFRARQAAKAAESEE